jgi:kelch-like protein 12
VDSEEPVFEAVINWVKHAKKEREESLPDLLQYVRMPLLTPRYITDVIDAEVSHIRRLASRNSTNSAA